MEILNSEIKIKKTIYDCQADIHVFHVQTNRYE